MRLRCSAAKGYLNPVKKRSNLKIIVNAHVQKINFEGKKAVGVNYYFKDKLITVKANREVILSAGSIGSPHILQVSGIGDSSKLKSRGIEVIHELKGVGKNLQDHLMFRPVYKVKNLKSLNGKRGIQTSNPKKKSINFSKRIFYSLLTVFFNQVTNFVNFLSS